MKRKIVTTGDGSSTIFLPDWKETYHSTHGAVEEARHVFIKIGLNNAAEEIMARPINILEIGFGTGLNALLTLERSIKDNLELSYTGVEAFPISKEEIMSLNYPDLLIDLSDYFQMLHTAKWEAKNNITENFSLRKLNKKIEAISDSEAYHLIYFDAFCARVQPELWTEKIFLKMYRALQRGGTLVTYSAKGSVRRAMQNAGFNVERLPGPPGKREMLRACKIN